MSYDSVVLSLDVVQVHTHTHTHTHTHLFFRRLHLHLLRSLVLWSPYRLPLRLPAGFDEVANNVCKTARIRVAKCKTTAASHTSSIAQFWDASSFRIVAQLEPCRPIWQPFQPSIPRCPELWPLTGAGNVQSGNGRPARRVASLAAWPWRDLDTVVKSPSPLRSPALIDRACVQWQLPAGNSRETAVTDDVINTCVPSALWTKIRYISLTVRSWSVVKRPIDSAWCPELEQAAQLSGRKLTASITMMPTSNRILLPPVADQWLFREGARWLCEPDENWEGLNCIALYDFIYYSYVLFKHCWVRSSFFSGPVIDVWNGLSALSPYRVDFLSLVKFTCYVNSFSLSECLDFKWLVLWLCVSGSYCCYIVSLVVLVYCVFIVYVCFNVINRANKWRRRRKYRKPPAKVKRKINGGTESRRTVISLHPGNRDGGYASALEFSGRNQPGDRWACHAFYFMVSGAHQQIGRVGRWSYITAYHGRTRFCACCTPQQITVYVCYHCDGYRNVTITSKGMRYRNNELVFGLGSASALALFFIIIEQQVHH